MAEGKAFAKGSGVGKASLPLSAKFFEHKDYLPTYCPQLWGISCLGAHIRAGPPWLLTWQPMV